MALVTRNKQVGNWQKYFLLFILLIGFILFKDRLLVFTNSLSRNLFGLSNKPISYRINQLDPGFGLTQEDALSALAEAEKVWESPFGKELFISDPQGNLAINFVYDKRQASTNELQNLDNQVSEETAEFESYKQNYDVLVKEYNQKKAALEEKINNYQSLGSEYENKLRLYKSSGSDPEKASSLNDDMERLSQMYREITVEQDNLTSLVSRINSLAQGANRSLPQLNDNVRAYNDLLADNSGEFQEGEYLYKSGKQSINIYQFTDRQDLIFLLAHELGHALGLEHSANPNSLMYKLNYSQTASVVEDDLRRLRELY